MRKRQTFLLTIVTPEDDADPFHGRIKVISSGKSCTFTSVDELYQLILSEIGEDTVQRLSNTPCADEKAVSS